MILNILRKKLKLKYYQNEKEETKNENRSILFRTLGLFSFIDLFYPILLEDIIVYITIIIIIMIH